jgi:hypothetical protein
VIHLVHAFVQDGHDADVAVRQPAPIDKVPFVAGAKAVDTEFGRHGFRRHPAGLDLVEGLEQSGDVAFRLFGAKAFARIAIDLVEAVRGRPLDADGGQLRFRAMTSAAVSGS